MRLHHANISLLPDQVTAEIEWLTDVLGYKKIPVEPSSRALWFEAGDKTELHLSPDTQHDPKTRAHLALEFDDLGIIQERLERRGTEFTFNDRDTLLVVNCDDPAGNHWELRQEVASH